MLVRLLFPLLILSSCTFVNKYVFQQQASEFEEAFDIAGTKKGATLAKKQNLEKQAPLSVEIAQAFFDQEKLNVKVILTTHTEINPNDVVLGVTGLTDGELVEETYKKVSDVVASDMLDANTKIALRFELDKKDLSEYQVKCSWGEEAKELWAKLTPAPIETRASLSQELINAPALSGNLELSNIDIQSEELQCVLAPCDLTYTVIGKFYNGKDSPVAKAKLAIGLYWANSGQVPAIPALDAPVNENEELVEVALGLQSRESATIKIKLDRSVPQVPGGSFIPHVRLISSE